MSATGRRGKSILLASALLLLAGGGWLLHCSGFFAAAGSLETLRDYILGCAPYAHLCFFLLQLSAVVLAPIPSNVVAAAGGALFGTGAAFLLTFGAVMCGSLLTFSLARTLGQDFAARIVSRRLSEKYQTLLRAKAPVFLTLAFLFPFFPDDILCILAGLTDLSLGRFALIAALTRPWGLLFASALGGAALDLPPWAMLPITLAGGAVFWLGMKYGDKIEAHIMERLGGQRHKKTPG